MKNKDTLYQVLLRYWRSKWRDGRRISVDDLVDDFRRHPILRVVDFHRAGEVLQQVMYRVRITLRKEHIFIGIIFDGSTQNKINAYKKLDPNSIEDRDIYEKELRKQLAGVHSRIVISEDYRIEGQEVRLITANRVNQLVADFEQGER